METIRRFLRRRIFDFNDPASLAATKRRARFALFWGVIENLPKPVRVLDIGGTQEFWKSMGCEDAAKVHVTLLNLTPQPVCKENFVSLVGDGTHLDGFADNEFDVSFCSSVIEHCGTYERQRALASEVRRVGKCYYVQTPNWWFPIEPHFVFPGFQWLPVAAKVALMKRFNLGWVKKWPEPDKPSDVWGVQMTGHEFIRSIRLLTASELRALFPEGRLWRERLLGFTKSLVICGCK